jgi:orotidine-5'-phosphate decarboxylase
MAASFTASLRAARARLLCRTSNPGGAVLQALDVGGEKLYERVARLAAGTWNRSGELGLVVGATVPAEFARVREIAPTLPLRVPGIGAQGGDVAAAVAAGRDRDPGRDQPVPQTLTPGLH